MEEYKNEDQVKRMVRKGRGSYVDSVISIDTETTSIKEGEEGYGICYIWMIGIDNKVIYGRYLEQLQEAVNALTTINRKIVIYCHNLSFDFQVLRNVIPFTNVFARETREVIRARYKNIEFRCSYALSGMSLDDLCNKYGFEVLKLHNYDYDKIRHPESVMTDEEMLYCEHDCLVVNEYIKKMLSIYGNYRNIPLTFTGITRKKMKAYIKNNYTGHREDFAVSDWKRMVNNMSPTPIQFKLLCKCFAGGYVHSNPLYTGRVLEGVKSVDFTSSYIYSLLSEKYPMGRFFKCYYEVDPYNLDKDYAYILKLRLHDVTLKGFMSFLSLSKVELKETHGFLCDNGRINSADQITLYCNEHDWEIIRNVYDIKSVELLEARSCHKEYLPKVFIEFVKSLYLEKQALKPFKSEKMMEYEMAKSALNSCYGMATTCYVTDLVKYDGEWEKEEIDDEGIIKQLEDLETNKRLMLPYCWGVWCSSASRLNLFKNILAFDDFNIVYCDTDSIKYFGNHDDVINEYNLKCVEKIKKMCEELDVEYDGLQGLGEWDFEPEADKFITLGAKKYCYEKDNKLILSLSGVNKKEGPKAMKDVTDFHDGFVFSEEYTKKKGKYYNDEQREIKITDYNGNTIKVSQKYGIYLFPVSYRLTITPEYDMVIKKYSRANILM